MRYASLSHYFLSVDKFASHSHVCVLVKMRFGNRIWSVLAATIHTMAKIAFLGGTGTVTGSKYLVEANRRRLLIDCGLFQGRKEWRLRNWERLPVDPSTINWVLLTHAHLDHTGYLPRLVNGGFRGPILANEATRELCELLLPDSAHLMTEDARHAAKHGYSKHKPPLPLYTVEDAFAALRRFESFPRTGEYRISPEFLVRSRHAGHILGASSLELIVSERGRHVTVLFSGDLGRYDQPILNDPEVPPKADFVLCESTYGDREHPANPPQDAALAHVINRVAQRGGIIVVPAFAVDRTQLLMYTIRKLEDTNQIPRLPVYVDSPMAIDATAIYLKHRSDHDAEFASAELDGSPLQTHDLHVMRTVQESKLIADVKSRAIIISASGMATGGRVLHHLKRCLPDPRNCVLLVGFQAEGTRGSSLENGVPYLKIHGQMIPVRAEVVSLRQFSAHAGRNELLRWLSGSPAPPKQLFLVHGEPGAAQALKSAVQVQFKWNVITPAYLQSAELIA
jgi:metallo-beta-lactamase family protein